MSEENTKELTASQLSEQEGFRRDKLAALQAEGKDPFEIVKYDVTPVSYTHLDVYKRQARFPSGRPSAESRPLSQTAVRRSF